MQKVGDITFTVKFEDGRTVKMTADQIAKLRDARKYEVLDSRGLVILRKTYKGL